MIYFTSDTHIGHKNICHGISNWDNKDGCRMFDNCKSMFEYIVEKINSVVQENDTLWHLGDWSFGSMNNACEFRKAIKCKNVHLIFGNHDGKHGQDMNAQIPNWFHVRTLDGDAYSWPETYFEDTNKLPPAVDYTPIYFQDLFSSVNYYKEIFYQKTRICMMHYPIASWNEMSHGSINLFGHCHSTPENKFFNGGKSMDVGMDGNQFSPYSIDEIMEIMEDRNIKQEGHH